MLLFSLVIVVLLFSLVIVVLLFSLVIVVLLFGLVIAKVLEFKNGKYRFNMRIFIAKLASSLGVLSSIWFLLGMFEIVPLVFTIPGETSFRTHASLAVLFLMIASWGFWNSD